MFSIALGSAGGLLLCMAFYSVTGLANTLFSSAPLLRQAADFVCIMVFSTFGIVFVERLWLLVSRRQQTPRQNA